MEEQSVANGRAGICRSAVQSQLRVLGLRYPMVSVIDLSESRKQSKMPDDCSVVAQTAPSKGSSSELGAATAGTKLARTDHDEMNVAWLCQRFSLYKSGVIRSMTTHRQRKPCSPLKANYQWSQHDSLKHTELHAVRRALRVSIT